MAVILAGVEQAISNDQLRRVNERIRVPDEFPTLGINGKERIHLGHDPEGGLVPGIEFDRVEELAPGMGPAGHVHQAFTAHVIVGPIAITL